ncbi:MAG: ABC transporter permease, partial [Polyangiaceae bacterium]
GVLIAIVIGSTSLYRELEHKTIFPILSRPIRRWEYLLGKYFGAVLTIVVFASIQSAAVLSLLAIEGGQAPRRVGALVVTMLAALALLFWRARHVRVFVVIPWGLALAAIAWFIARPAGAERQLVAASAVLSVFEVVIVAAVAMLFASFSSPFLTAAFTSMIFLIGRSADTLAHFPKRAFGAAVASGGRDLARVVPNLHIFVPPRPLLLGDVTGHPTWGYVGWAALHAVAYAAALLVIAAFAFQKRDFA